MSNDIPFFPVPLDLSDVEVADGLRYKASTFSWATSGNEDLISSDVQSTVALANRVIKVLLTTKGSVPNNPQEGSNFNGLVKNGYNPNTLNEDIALILLDVEGQIKRLEASTRGGVALGLGSIELLSLELLDSSYLKLVIGIKNSKGRVVPFELVY